MAKKKYKYTDEEWESFTVVPKDYEINNPESVKKCNQARKDSNHYDKIEVFFDYGSTTELIGIFFDDDMFGKLVPILSKEAEKLNATLMERIKYDRGTIGCD